MSLVIRAALNQSGVKSLYTGLSASLLRQMTYSLVRLGSYETIKRWLAKGQKPKTSQLILAAGLAGGLGGIAGNPAVLLDVLLVRMTSDPMKPASLRYHYRNALDGLYKLLRREGFEGLTRGMGTNTVRAVLMNTSQLASYDYFKNFFLSDTPSRYGLVFHDNLVLHTLSSVAAGGVATTITAPADVIRSRVMSSNGGASALYILSASLRAEGPSFLFRGWSPAFMRLGPNTVLMFVFLEQLKKGWSLYADRS
ncbi:mitochondrial carrier [Sistotremastrum niveocremeum HHB9708]|uniref:Mitochondrial carrier n=1 Tax=Sistotremastrum niveocremeum HHB9708 TaxID=1314777 RepID=A0A164R7U8_9AGAM|nr:mitochondrial carrier [Sistotremastrum niveocremeum HHB9708]